MRKKNILLILSFLILTFLTGCASKAWMIQQTPEGGTIGYTVKRKDFRKKIKKLIHCHPYTVIDDKTQSRQIKKVVHNYISSSPTTGGYANSPHSGSQVGGSSVHQNTPIYVTQKETWKELRYKCDRPAKK